MYPRAAGALKDANSRQECKALPSLKKRELPSRLRSEGEGLPSDRCRDTEMANLQRGKKKERNVIYSRSIRGFPPP
jgi:hypothetical protein